MGSNVAREAVNDSASIINSAINSATQTAKTSFNASEEINVKNCKNVDIENVDFSEYVTINVQEQLTAYQKNTEETQIKTQIEQTVKQILGFLAITPGSNEANIITDLVTNITNSMSNTFTQTCAESSSVRQGVVCSDSDNVKINGIKFSTYENNVNNCIGNDVGVNTAKNALIQNVTQNVDQTKAGLFSFFGWIAVIVIAVVVAVLLIAIFGIATAGLIFGDPIAIFGFILFAFSIVLFLLAFGYFPQWWPYETETVLDSQEEKKNKKRKNLILLIVSGSLAILTLAVTILIFFRGLPKQPSKYSTQIKSLEQAVEKRKLEEAAGLLPPTDEAPGSPFEEAEKERLSIPDYEAPGSPIEEAETGGVLERLESKLKPEIEKGEEFFTPNEEALEGAVE